jgi:hypothetical protein
MTRVWQDPKPQAITSEVTLHSGDRDDGGCDPSKPLRVVANLCEQQGPFQEGEYVLRPACTVAGGQFAGLLGRFDRGA